MPRLFSIDTLCRHFADLRAKEYQFNKEKPVNTHYFCPTCGTSITVKVTDPDHPRFGRRALTVRSIKDLDLDTLTIKKFDGRAT